jgi:hypothetical protein
MSSTEIYGFNKEWEIYGDSYFIGEVKNSFRGAMAIWTYLEDKYLPPYIPLGMKEKITRMISINKDEKETQKVWDLWKDNRLEENEKIVMLSTFDRVIVKRGNIDLLLKAFMLFKGDTNLKKQAEIIDKEIKNNKNIIAIAWNQTSVNSNPWSVHCYKIININEISDEGMCEETNIEECSRPYNLYKDDNGHWFLFEEYYKVIK